MEKIHLVSIAEIPETQRKKALERYQIIDPIISQRKTISEIAKKSGLTERTLFRLVYLDYLQSPVQTIKKGAFPKISKMQLKGWLFKFPSSPQRKSNAGPRL